MASGRSIFILVLYLSCSGTGIASGAQVNRAPCADEVHVVANNERLSDVLAELGRTYGFTAKVAPAADTRVTIEMTAQPSKVIAALTRYRSAVYIEGVDGDCGGITVPVRLWVLEDAESGSQSTAQVNARPAASLLSLAATTVTERTVRDSAADADPNRRENRSQAERQRERLERQEARRQGGRPTTTPNRSRDRGQDK